MTNVRYVTSGVCCVAAILLAPRLRVRPSDTPRGPLPRTQMSEIMGGSENGGGCATLKDTTSCPYKQPDGFQMDLDLCMRDADFEEKKQAFIDGCQGYTTGVGAVETAGPPLKPNTNEVQAADKAACEADYEVTYDEEEGMVEGCAGYSIRLICAPEWPGHGEPTSYVKVNKCNDP